MFAGRSTDAKRRLYRAVVTNLGRLGIPPTDVVIVLREEPPENWGIRGGTPASLEPSECYLFGRGDPYATDANSARSKVAGKPPTWLLVERVTGIEPVSRAWKARALPLSYTRVWGEGSRAGVRD